MFDFCSAPRSQRPPSKCPHTDGTTSATSAACHRIRPFRPAMPSRRHRIRGSREVRPESCRDATAGVKRLSGSGKRSRTGVEPRHPGMDNPAVPLVMDVSGGNPSTIGRPHHAPQGKSFHDPYRGTIPVGVNSSTIVQRAAANPVYSLEMPNACRAGAKSSTPGRIDRTELGEILPR